MAKTAKKPKSVIEAIKDTNSGKPNIIRIGFGKPPRAECSCGWSTEPSEDLFKLGVAAFQHRNDTGHQLRQPEDPGEV